jgi:hypothetical protein
MFKKSIATIANRFESCHAPTRLVAKVAAGVALLLGLVVSINPLAHAISDIYLTPGESVAISGNNVFCQNGPGAPTPAPVPSQRFDINASCNNWDLSVVLTDLSNGKDTITKESLSGSSECSYYAAEINAKASQLIYGGKFAVCNNWNLSVFTVLTNGTMANRKTSLSGSTACRQEADRINHKP